MKIGTDAMLLGSWALPPPGQSCRILDVGTGTGVLALMMAQKTATGNPPAAATSADAGGLPAHQTAAQGAAPKQHPPVDPSPVVQHSAVGSGPRHGGGDGGGAQILAIDVAADACAQAAENSALSPWAARIRVLHAGLQQLTAAAVTAAAAAATAAAATAAAATAAAATAAAAADPPKQEATAWGPEVAASGGRELAAPAVAAAVGLAGAKAEPEEASAAAPPSCGGREAAGVTAEDVGPFDLIITNPPYFVASSKPAQGRVARASARHADVSLPFSDLAAGCAALLARGGSVCVVLPAPEAERFCVDASACGLTLVELVRVFTAPEDERERRHLMRFQRAADLLLGSAQARPLPATSTLVISGPKQQQSQPATGPRLARPLTPEYLALTADFHDPSFLAAAAAAGAAAAAATTAAHTDPRPAGGDGCAAEAAAATRASAPAS